VADKRKTHTAEQLAGYRSKRDFKRTAEPAGAAKGKTTRTRAKRRGEPRFVIHEHHARRLHWDLRLERDGVLASWAVPKGIPEDPGENRFAAATEDHPVEYLDFEGEIPKGEYGAGKMTIWDHGTYECLKWEPRKVEVALRGERLCARYALFPIGRGEDPSEWMIHRMDPPADETREPMPHRLSPMLATAGAVPGGAGEFAYEIKWDGVRAIAYSSPGSLELQSRNLNDITTHYPELSRLGRALGSHSAILDGEIVCLDADGRPSFQALQRRMHLSSESQARAAAKRSPVTFQIFDLLWLDGHPLMGLPYTERHELLQKLKLDGEHWRTPGYVLGDGNEVLRASAEQGLEGIVAKRVDSTYEPGRRTRAWVKVKNVGREDFHVAGWTSGKGARGASIGALLLGVSGEDGSLRYVGNVGSGFTATELERLGRALKPLARVDSPFTRDGPAPPRGAHFCEPRLLADVEFSGWTDAGRLRHPTYKGFRETAPARARARAATTRETPAQRLEREGAIVRELTPKGAVIELEGRELTFSNLEKVLYPKARFAKLDVISYYLAIAPALLPHLAGRALTVTRWPDGVQADSFFAKQAPAHRPKWVATARIEHSKKPVDYVVCDDRATLAWLANLAALELHAPLALARAPKRPTALVFDLDPGPPAAIAQCARVALLLHGLFENLGLQSFAKTSGKKGMQVYVPLNAPRVTFEQCKPFAKTVAEMLERAEPDLIVSRMTKARRRGKVLIDWSQNDGRKTTVAAYSLRAAERPTISTPLEWEEVRTALRARGKRALTFEPAEVLERVRENGDLFAPVASLVQALPEI
jgi:bifunctional non-homologous end joining protein LigD